MLARMTAAHARPECFDEGVATVREAFLPAAQGQPGYADFLLPTDPAARQPVGISLWATAGDPRASGGGCGYYGRRMADFVGYLTEPPTTTTHEVAIREP
jgi:hypothetical protein